MTSALRRRPLMYCTIQTRQNLPNGIVSAFALAGHPEIPMTRSDIIELQTRLSELGYRPGPVDGWYGEQTQRAYQQYLSDQNGSIPNLAPATQKPWYLSRAVLGAMATIIASGAGIAGWVVDAGHLADILSSMATLVFGVLAFVGTIQRKGEIRRGKITAVSESRGVDDGVESNTGQLHVELPAGHRAERERAEDAGWNG